MKDTTKCLQGDTYPTLAFVHAVWRKTRHQFHLRLCQCALPCTLVQIEAVRLRRQYSIFKGTLHSDMIAGTSSS